MEILIKAFIAFGLAFLIIAFLHWLVNKNNEKQEVYHGSTPAEPVPEPEYKCDGDLTYVKWRENDNERRR